ncbi:MAG TPA: HAMP domain-containing sensor histidine kinase, partial [Leptospiraceae bacterium]|nr:HAMP domain-containing sensor histidine kinase [Leptospiraceae bacterium]
TVSAEEKDGKIEVSIQDSGIGMDRQTSDNLFRIDVKHFSKDGTKGEKGTGLGLILCKEFIDRHGGKIWAESEPGTGSTFRFTLPKNPI